MQVSAVLGTPLQTTSTPGVVAATTPFAVGMLSHGVVDLLTHRGSAYNHLFPLPLSPMRGPFNYTDPVFTAIEHAALLASVLWLMNQRRRRADHCAPAVGVNARGLGPP